MAKSRYANTRIIKTRDGKRIHSLHQTAKFVDTSKMSFIPITVSENTRLDTLAGKYLGNGRYWYILAYINNLFYPWNIKKGSIILVPQNVQDILDYF